MSWSAYRIVWPRHELYDPRTGEPVLRVPEGRYAVARDVLVPGFGWRPVLAGGIHKDICDASRARDRLRKEEACRT